MYGIAVLMSHLCMSDLSGPRFRSEDWRLSQAWKFSVAPGTCTDVRGRYDDAPRGRPRAGRVAQYRDIVRNLN